MKNMKVELIEESLSCLCVLAVPCLYYNSQYVSFWSTEEAVL